MSEVNETPFRLLVASFEVDALHISREPFLWRLSMEKCRVDIWGEEVMEETRPPLYFLVPRLVEAFSVLAGPSMSHPY